MEHSIILSQIDPAELKDLIRATVTEVLEKQTPAPTETRYRTTIETCALLHITKPTLNEYVKKGLIQGKRFGRRILYSEQDIQDAVKDIPNLKYSRRR